MRSIATTVVLAVTVLCLGVAPPAHAQNLLFDYVGFDYEDPNSDPLNFGMPGEMYVGVGECPVLFAPLVTNTAVNQYTYHLTGLFMTNRIVAGSFVVVDYAGPGTLTVYEDPIAGGTDFDYGINPPNGTAPSTFTDGTPILVGQITNLRLILNTATGSGSYDADYEAVGGTQIGNIPLNERKGWTFAGVTGNTISVPLGYAHQVDGQVFLQQPTPTRNASWGKVKHSYR